MRIPEVQEALREWAAEWGKPELARIADELSRRSPKERAPKTSATMTDELADRIRSYKAQNPNATQMQVAIRFNVNTGRVSEVLRGYRQ